MQVAPRLQLIPSLSRLLADAGLRKAPDDQSD